MAQGTENSFGSDIVGFPQPVFDGLCPDRVEALREEGFFIPVSLKAFYILCP
jgi:hypothetical protein